MFIRGHPAHGATCLLLRRAGGVCVCVCVCVCVGGGSSNWVTDDKPPEGVLADALHLNQSVQRRSDGYRRAPQPFHLLSVSHPAGIWLLVPVRTEPDLSQQILQKKSPLKLLTALRHRKPSQET